MPALIADLVIRQASPDDAGSLAALLVELGYPAAPESIPQRLAHLGGDGCAVALVAVRGDQVLGAATLHLLHTLHASEQVAQLTLLIVAAEARGQGVGCRRVGAVEGYARACGCARIVVTTAEHRTGAHVFYARLGYEYTGRRYTKPLVIAAPGLAGNLSVCDAAVHPSLREEA